MNLEEPLKKCLAEVSEPIDVALLASIVQGIADSSFDLLKLVEALGESLSSSSAPLRLRATDILASVFERLHGVQLTPADVAFLVQFLGQRMKDVATATPVLRAVHALAFGQNAFLGNEVKVVRSIFAEFQFQSLGQESRMWGFALMSLLLDRYLPALKELGDDFVFGFIQQMDGERDPRNLLVAFAMIPRIIGNFSIDRFVEELFEIVSCYFPITFSAPPGDKKGITRADLILGLRNCLKASPLFAPFTVNLILDKVTSTNEEIKVDCWETLAECAAAYGTAIIPSLSRISESFRGGLLATGDNERIAVRHALKVIAHAISLSPALSDFIQPCITSALNALLVPDGRIIRAEGANLVVIIESSIPAAKIVLSQFLNRAFDQFGQDSSLDFRVQLVSVVVELLAATIELSKSHPEDNPAAEYKPIILPLFTMLANDPQVQFRKLAVSGLAGLIHAGMTTMPELVAIARQVASMIISDIDKEVRSEALLTAVVIARRTPAIVVNQILPMLMDVLVRPADDSVLLTATGVLQAVMTLSVMPDIIAVTIPTFLRLISDLALSETVSEDHVSHARSAAECILQVVQANLQSTVEWINVLVLPLLSIIVASQNSMTDDVLLVSSLASIFRNITQVSSVEGQLQLVRLFMDVFVTGSLSKLSLPQSRSVTMVPLSSQSPQRKMLRLLTSVVCSTSREAFLPEDEALKLSLAVLDIARGDEDPKVVAASGMCLGGLVNKMGEVGIDSIVKATLKLLDESVTQGIVTALVWLAKALILRAHGSVPLLVSRLFSCFESDAGTVAADGVFVIMDDCKEVLNKSSHANIKPLYKQRFFQSNIASIIERYKAVDDARVKGLYLLAVAHLLLTVPKQILLIDLPLLLPMLLETLHSSEIKLQVTALNTLYTLTFDAPEIISQHIKTLIASYLRLAKSQDSMKLRICALQSLGILSSLPAATLVPFAKEVIRSLQFSLDDRKRLVREEAVKCRSRWLLVQ